MTQLCRCEILKLSIIVLCSIFNVLGEHENENPITDLVRHSVVTTARSCMVHVEANVTDLEHLREEPPYPEKSACIVKCLLEKISIVKNNRFSKIGFMTAVTPLVIMNRKKLEHMKAVSESCDKEVNHHEVTQCQLGNEITACIFKYAPELHFKS